MRSAARIISKSIWKLFTFGIIAATSAAFAQSPPGGDKLDEIEKQIKALQTLVGEMRGPAKAAPTSNAPAAANNSTSTAAPTDASSRGGFRGRDRETVDPIVTKIREEGLNHSQVMATLDYLTNVIGPRLTCSPNARRANEWTRGKLEGWGLTSARLESWGPFGRGWVLKRFSIQVIQPQTIPLIACPKAWSPGFDKPLEAAVVWLDAKTDADLKKYEGKLKGAIVLADPLRPLKPHFDAQGLRMTEADLLTYANSTGRRIRPAAPPPKGTPSTEFSLSAIAAANAAEAKSNSSTAGADQDSARRPSGDGSPPAATDGAARGAGDSSVPTSDDSAQRRRFGNPFSGKVLAFCAKEGAALVLTSSPMGDGGTVFVAAASVPGSEGRFRGGPRPWSEDAPTMPPQICVAVEDYNRLVHMIQQGEELKMAVDLEVQFTPTEKANNTIAEIAGSDLKDEIVMVGGHLDSWHAGTGATDNGAGVAVAMEAVRILKAVGVKPRRTIRIGLWTGEEQGLLGSRAYVTQHFGTPARGFDVRPTDIKVDNPIAEDKSPDAKPSAAKSAEAKKDVAKSDETKPAGNKPMETKSADAKSPEAKAADAKPVRLPEHDKLSVYFNLDNGTGRIRGIFTQGNEAAVPLFRKWLVPFHDLGADTVSLANTGSTDHISFEAVTLPGFEFMQDPIEYMTRSHHSNQDVFDRVPEDDLKQAAVIMAAFAYDAAMMDQRFPRKAE
jgi:Zn-dependent M28 family amino/carboxypeptidase